MCDVERLNLLFTLQPRCLTKTGGFASQPLGRFALR